MNKRYGRRITTEVTVGNTVIGGDNPIRIQSMTNTSTLDTAATVNQIMRIAEAGADIVRLTVQSMKEAENLVNIKNKLIAGRCLIPLVADVHFNPAIAEAAASIVDKVRINPGNYGIKQKSGSGILTEEEYNEDLHRAREKFALLLKICRRNNTALRIGVNHGSLSSRILNRYGNTPEGMVESAMEFLRFCVEENFHSVIISLKSSNTLVMTQANIAMVNYMASENMSYPLHLGVTEAGEGDDGRIRSAVGIGTLLALGIGSTIRVSLTEDPEREIPVARQLVSHIEQMHKDSTLPPDRGNNENILLPYQWNSVITSSTSHQVNQVANIGGEQVPVVVAGQQETKHDNSEYRKPVQSGIKATNDLTGSLKHADTGSLKGEGRSEREAADNDFLVPDYIFTKSETDAVQPAASEIITFHDIWHKRYRGASGIFPLITVRQYKLSKKPGYNQAFLQISLDNLTDDLLSQISHDPNLVLVALAKTGNPSGEFGKFIKKVRDAGCKNPVILKKKYETADEDYFRIQASVDFGSVLLGNEGQGMWIENNFFSADFITSLSFSILQSCRRRISKTEFISCPSCGRTMFDIQKATSLIKGRTSHLRGLKIAVMGCIVNGPGEMTDADYGYVGAGRGRVSLYKKKVVVKRNIPEEQAIDELINLIRESGDWVER